MYKEQIGIDQGRHGQLYFQFTIFDTTKELHKDIKIRDGEVNKDLVGQCSQPNISFDLSGDRRAQIIFQLVFTKEEFYSEVFWHEVYHALSLYHRMLDALGPFDDGEDYYQNNEEDVANLTGALIPVAYQVFRKMKKEAHK